MVRDHDEIYDELMEKKQSEEREKLDTTGDASVGKSKYRLPKKSVDEGVETLKPTEPSRKAKPVVKIAALEAGGDISKEKVMAKLKSNPLVKDLSEKPEKMSTLPKDSQQDFVPKNAKDLLKSYRLASGGTVKSASARADGCAIRGKTRA